MQISKTLYDLGKSIANADTYISALCFEVSALSNFLSSVEQTLQGCQHQFPSFALADSDLWNQSKLALVNCQITLDELKLFVDRLQETSRRRGFWKAKAAVDLKFHAAEIEAARAKINKSNWAIQTMLHAITV